MSDTQLVGPDGKPARHQAEEIKVSGELKQFLQKEVKTEVETSAEVKRILESRIKAEVAAALHDDRIKGWIKYSAVVLVNTVLAVLLYVLDFGMVRDLTSKYVTEHMNKPELHEVAKEVVRENADTFVTEKLQPTLEAVALVRSNIHDAEATLSRLQEDQRLLSTAMRAEAFDRPALLDLQSLSKGTNLSSRTAFASLRRVRRTLDDIKVNVTQPGPIPKVDVGTNCFLGPFCSEDIVNFLDNPATAEGAVNYISQQRWMLFVPALVELAHSSDDLTLVNRISMAIENLAGIKFDAWDLKPLDAWWSAHESHYTNWPFADYREGIKAFRSRDFTNALRSFERVISIDPGADQSRAFAVASAAESLDLKKASNLMTGFVLTDHRLERWAKAKLLLASGDATAAVKELTETLEFPIMWSDSDFNWQTIYLFRDAIIRKDNGTPKPL